MPFTTTISLVRPEDIVIDYYPETYNYVYGVPNKVYFQAYSNQDRVKTIDLSNMSFVGLNAQGQPISDLQQQPSGLISTINLGRGYFEFVPQRGAQYSLQNPQIGRNGVPVLYALNVSEEQPDIDEWEINFSVTKKVIENDENL